MTRPHIEMMRILITGMSGTGKSSVVELLRSRGFAAIDTDYGEWCEFSTWNGSEEWIWRAERMHELLRRPITAPLFVSGCRANQAVFYDYFDLKVLLSAPLNVMLERIATRPTNPYGKSAEERAEICRNFERIQPLLQRSTDMEIDSATVSVNELAALLVEIAGA